MTNNDKVLNACGPICLQLISASYGRHYSLQYLIELCKTSRNGTNLLSLCNAANKIGLSTLAIKVCWEKIIKARSPFIALINSNHYVAIYNITQNCVLIVDPSRGLVEVSTEYFLMVWVGTNDIKAEGIAILLQSNT